MVKPNLFVVGAPKSGTTSLYMYFKRHPSIFVPDDKEPHFFGEHSVSGEKKYRSYEKYLDLYRDEVVGDVSVVADMSTSYLYSRKSASEIFNFNKDSKVIALLRNPADRAISMYYHQRKSLKESLDIESAFKEEEHRINKGWPYGYHYFNAGLYSEQVERYKALFGDSFKVFFFEDFVKDPAYVLKEVGEFSGVDMEYTTSAFNENKTGLPKSYILQKIISTDFFGKRFAKKMLGRNVREKIKKINIGEKESVPAGFKEKLNDMYKSDIERLESSLNCKTPWRSN